MFSGIVQACVPIVDVTAKPGLSRITVRITSELSKGLVRGASVSLSGACLTAISVKKNLVSFEAMQETLDKTTLGTARKGEKLNLERSIRFGDEIGGHVVSGHVDAMVTIAKISKPKNNHIVTFKCHAAIMRYVFQKGFIALDGVSLTVVGVDRKNNTFTVHFIPETLRTTSFGFKKEGDNVNVEVDRLTMAVVEATLHNQASRK